MVLQELGSGRRMEVVGVYAPCRGVQEEEEVWRKMDEMAKGKPDVVIAGDLNAETQTALARHKRGATWQDKQLQKLIEEHGLTVHEVGRATYREVSEIDYVLSGQGVAAGLMGAEWRPGQHEGDHGEVWVRMAAEEKGEGTQRPRGTKRDRGGVVDGQSWARYLEQAEEEWEETKEERRG